MARGIPTTFFAPAERWPIAVVQRQARRFDCTRLPRLMRQAALNYLVVLNARRQIVMASENVLELIPGQTIAGMIGMRLGEALGCVHARVCKTGCGTTRVCRCCAAIRATLRGLDGHRDLRDCHVVRFVHGRAQSLNLRVLATPLHRDHQRFTLLTMVAMPANSP